ncbi:hypothetical protein M1D93_13135 [Arthrobacter sp. Z1-9]
MSIAFLLVPHGRNFSGTPVYVPLNQVVAVSLDTDDGGGESWCVKVEAVRREATYIYTLTPTMQRSDAEYAQASLLKCMGSATASSVVLWNGEEFEQTFPITRPR